jgi:hypothetical protein
MLLRSSHVAEDHGKDYQRRAEQSICGVAACVTCAAKSIVPHSEAVSAVNIRSGSPFIRPGASGIQGYVQFARDVGPRYGSLFWENIRPFWTCESCLRLVCRQLNQSSNPFRMGGSRHRHLFTQVGGPRIELG